LTSKKIKSEILRGTHFKVLSQHNEISSYISQDIDE